MEDQVSSLILNELQGLRKEVTEGFSDTKQRITAIETHTDPFFANSGGLEKMQGEIDSLNRVRWYGMGVVAAITTGGHWLLHKVGL